MILQQICNKFGLDNAFWYYVMHRGKVRKKASLYDNASQCMEREIHSNYINIHSLAETKNPIYSELRVFYKGKKNIEYNPRCLCWWINGFNPKIQKIKTSNDLSLKCTADFSNVSKDLRKAFYKKAKKSYGKYWIKANKKKKTATFKW